MSWLSFLGIGGPRRDPLGRSPAQRLYIVDGSGLAEGRSRPGNGHPSPRDHYLALRNLAQFAGREKINLAVVFIGRPLREAGEGEEFKGVRVYYAERVEDRAAKLLKLARNEIRNRDVVLICGDPDVERQAAALHAASMRLSTLKKAMDEREDRGERDGEYSHRQGRSRPPMDRRHQPERQASPPEPEREAEPDDQAEAPPPPPEQERQEQPSPRPPAASPAPAPPAAEKPKLDPGVLDLIDPV